jgi:hypothetical protein
VDPLAIYVSAIAILLAFSLAVWIWRHRVTRVCPLCESRVEIGRTRCQVCDYNFALTQKPRSRG